MQLICIILPLLNEEDHIYILLERIKKSLSNSSFLICIIDDGSTDNTIDEIKRAETTFALNITLLERKKTVTGCQRGNALLFGMEWALENTDCNCIIEIDGDLSHDPAEIKAGLETLRTGNTDVVIGSKYLPQSNITGRKWTRNLISKMSSKVMRLLFSTEITDYSNGFRLYTRKAARIITLYQIRYGSPIYLSEVAAIWLKNEVNIKEFPSSYHGRMAGYSKFQPIDLLKAGVALLDIALRYYFFGFRKKSQE